MLQKTFHVKSYDVYPNSTIKPSAIQHYMQQFAREDCDNMGCTYINMRDVNMVFVLTKMGIKVSEPVFAYDELTVKTFNNRITGITFEREFEFFKNGKKIFRLKYLRITSIAARFRCREALIFLLPNLSERGSSVCPTLTKMTI